MRKKGRRFTMLGLLAAILIWVGVKGIGTKALDETELPVDLPGLGGSAAARPDAETASLTSRSPSDASSADLLWGELQKMKAAMAAGDLQQAWSAKARAETILPELPASHPQRERFQVALAGFDAELSRRIREAGAQLRLQRVLAADQLLRPALFGDEELRRRFLELNAGEDEIQASLALSQDELPEIPDPLPAGQQVRMLLGQDLEIGQIIRAGERRATLRLRSAEGLLYPEVDTHRLGLVDPSRSQALDQATRSLHAGDALLAGLWLQLAATKGGGESQRAVAIKRCLR